MEEWKGKQWTTISLLDLYRSLRHEWLNHLQVLRGYIAMDRTAEVKAYLNRLTEQHYAWSHLALFSDTQLVEYLITYSLRHPRIQLQLDVPERLDGLPSTEPELSLSFLQGLEYLSVQAIEEEQSFPRLRLAFRREDEHLLISLRLLAVWSEKPIDWLNGWQEELARLGAQSTLQLNEEGVIQVDSIW